MSEEPIIKEGESVDKTDNTPQYTEIELKAIEGGWRPLEEWEGDPDQWVDAKEFNQRGEYIERIKSQSSQIKGLEKKLSKVEKVISDLADHNKKLAERDFKDNMKTLKDLKRDAMESGEYDKVTEIEDKIEELKEFQKESKQKFEEQPNTQGDMHPDVLNWIEENTWYESDPILRGSFDALAQDYISKHPEAEKYPQQLLSRVTAELRKEFPHKFGGTRQRSAVTEPAEGLKGSTSRSQPKYSSKHLNEEQKRIGERFVRAGAMKDLNDYAKQLAELGELDAQKTMRG